MLSAAQGEVIFTVVSFLYEPHSELCEGHVVMCVKTVGCIKQNE